MDPIILLIVIALVGFLLLAAVVAVAVALVFVLRRPGPRADDPKHQSPYTTPLDRAKAAALELTAEEWEDFRRWVDGPRKPAPGQGEGITQ